MHPRNPYREAPDFKDLAAAYPPLSSFLRGRTLDFHNEEAQRCLTQALLKKDFNIELELPPDRLNYVLWIQDVISAFRRVAQAKEGFSEHGSINVRGLDIGTGASAIYPLLATSLEKDWTFVASELDPESYEFARLNVEKNDLTSRITVVHAKAPRVQGHASATMDDMHFGFDQIFKTVAPALASEFPSMAKSKPNTSAVPADGHPSDVHDNPNPIITHQNCQKKVEIQFTMCNPPFYTSAEDVTNSNNAKEEGAFGVCTGAPVEMITPGGEVHFVGSMVRESVRLSKQKQEHKQAVPLPEEQEDSERPSKRQKTDLGKASVTSPQDLIRRGVVRWYTSMLGKLSSVGEIVADMRKLGIVNYAITEFIQGQTRRWAVGWSLDDYRLPDELCRLPKPNPVLQPLLPPHNTLRCTLPNASSPPLAEELEQWLSRVEDLLSQNSDILVSCTSDPFTDFLPQAPSSSPPKSSTTLVIRASTDTWSRNARRKRARDSSVPISSHSARMVPDKDTAMICSIMVEGIELVSRWLYGHDRRLFESFVSHVTRRIVGNTGG